MKDIIFTREKEVIGFQFNQGYYDELSKEGKAKALNYIQDFIDSKRKELDNDDLYCHCQDYSMKRNGCCRNCGGEIKNPRT